MDYFRIQGGNALRGTVEASGAKNASLPALAATVLSGSPTTLRRVPGVADVRTMLKILGMLGAEVSAAGPGSGGWRISAPPSLNTEVPYELVKTMRASVLFLGPLVSRFGHVRISLPGGCAIGTRPIDFHLRGLEALGAEVSLQKGFVEARAKRLKGARFRFEKKSVTGAENLMMAAALADGTTVLENCAKEPEVQDLGALLISMGAKIDGLGTDTVTVEGVDGLSGADHRVIADRIEAGTYLLAGVVTRGEVTVAGVRPDHLGSLLDLLSELGAAVHTEADAITAAYEKPLTPRPILTAPYPDFPTDLQAQYMALATQIEGDTRIEEGIFESRFMHAGELARLGADIDVDGSVATVHGATPLEGAEVMATDLRASACLVLAGLTASGTTTVNRIYHLDRGYEGLEAKLNALGGRIERLAGR
jgi:UDP-N-acetylglucosamine 1-carboxyvinyltransferase